MTLLQHWIFSTTVFNRDNYTILRYNFSLIFFFFAAMGHANPVPDLPAINLTFPSTSLVLETVEFIKQHASINTVNHCIRSAYWTLLLSKKHPDYMGKTLDIEGLVIAVLMHDLGWATTKELLSKDKRFEVDGANIAKDFLVQHTRDSCQSQDRTQLWDKHRQQLVWDAIALHTTPSIGSYKEPEVALAYLGIEADFYGWRFPGGLISFEEYTAVATLYPRTGFADELIQIMCGLCRDKASTTFDNVAGDYGLQYGLDGHGGGLDAYTAKWEKNRRPPLMIAALRYLEQNASAAPNSKALVSEVRTARLPTKL